MARSQGVRVQHESSELLVTQGPDWLGPPVQPHCEMSSPWGLLREQRLFKTACGIRVLSYEQQKPMLAHGSSKRTYEMSLGSSHSVLEHQRTRGCAA